MKSNNTDVVPTETPPEVFTNGPLSQDVDDIIHHVKVTRLIGNRAARRYVGRHLTAVTLSNWRKFRKFPVGFRHPSARVFDDSGVELRQAARTAGALRKARA